MKKYIVLGLALMFCSFSFAQKKEIKEAEKAIKNNNYADAKSKLQAAEILMSAMDEKTKAKFYFLKGKAFYANGAGNNLDIAESLKSFKMLKDIEEQSGKKTYTSQADGIKLEMRNAFITKGSDAFEQKEYEVSSVNFERAYRLYDTDTLYLYNSAAIAVLGKKYDTALKLYNELMVLGYTGISDEYFATDAATGEEQSFPNAVLRDVSVKSGLHEKPRNVKTKSKAGEIAKNVALIYVEQGENEKAIEAIENAKQLSPNDFNLLVSEANIRYKIGEKDKYKELISQALEINPDNVELLFNLGVVAADEKDIESAKKYYDLAIEKDPAYIKAKMNMAALILDQEQGVIEAMNKLGSSAADDKKYEELKKNRQQLYNDAIPYLTAILDVDPKNLSAAKTLMNIYSAIDDMPNFNAMKAKVDELSEN